ncbi:hypothetical protein ACT16_23950 [Mycobacterium heckeshornense]|nr:hypothetical protein ACT16_23950 [Mycobacterium heckeshornense]
MCTRRFLSVGVGSEIEDGFLDDVVDDLADADEVIYGGEFDPQPRSLICAPAPSSGGFYRWSDSGPGNLGGVVRPVPAGGVGPVGSSGGVDAEQVGEDGGGDGGGQLEHRCAVAGLGVNAEPAEACSEPRWRDRLCGKVSGEQPVAARRGETGVAARGVEVGAHETG